MAVQDEALYKNNRNVDHAVQRREKKDIEKNSKASSAVVPVNAIQKKKCGEYAIYVKVIVGNGQFAE